VSAALTRVGRAMGRFPEVWVLFGPAVYLLLVLTPPFLSMAGFTGAAHGVFVCFRYFCHQRPERTIFIGGFPMAVCARCFALGAGIVSGAAIAGPICRRFPSIKVPVILVVLAALPMALDGFTQLFGFRESTNTLRVLTGLLLGGMTSFWAVPIVHEAFREGTAEIDGS
jgi:uncharacterized membrane protein